MDIKWIHATSIKDSRKNKTIKINIKTSKGKFCTAAPAGKSRGRFEKNPYHKSLEKDIKFIDKLDIKKVNSIIDRTIGNKKQLTLDKAFSVLMDIGRLTKNKIGANTLYSLQASLLKALAKENKKELWEFLLNGKKAKMPRSVGNAIGGGLHSKGIKGKRPDIQEFLFIANGKSFRENVKLNELAYKLAGRFFGFWKTRNDEGAWETDLSNGEVIVIMQRVQKYIENNYKKNINIGLDVAAISFYKYGKYLYKNNEKILITKEQIEYMSELIKRYKLFYVEDPLFEDDFKGFKNLKNKTRGCLIVGDDLIVTNPDRLKRAIKIKSVNAIIVKPNQIGSLVKVKEVIDLAKKNNIKTTISHRSGETADDTIADLAVGFGCDFIKTGIYGSVRKAKLNRLIKIERKMKK